MALSRSQNIILNVVSKKGLIVMTKEEMIIEISKLSQECNDLSLLDLIIKLLTKSL